MSTPTVLLINGNTSDTVTTRLRERAAQQFPDVKFHVLAPRFGPAYVSDPADVVVAGHGVLTAIEEGIAALGRQPDACIIGCFGEPGLMAARHRWRFPIVGMAEASVLTALQMGGRYGVLTAGRHWPRMLADLLRGFGVDQRCAGILEVEGEPLAFADDPAAALRAVNLALKTAMQQFQPDVLILGGVSLVGLAVELRQSPVPVIDCFDAAVGQALALVALNEQRMPAKQPA